MFVGGTLQRTTALPQNYNYYGWDSSVSERPYKFHQWIGATLDASGTYRNSTSGVSTKTDDGQYNVMIGPSVFYKLKGLHPFARAMGGMMIDRNSTSAGSQSGSTVNTTYNTGMAFGGGLDIVITPRLAIRGQGDWIRIWNSNLQGVDTFRTSAGFVFRFRYVKQDIY